MMPFIKQERRKIIEESGLGLDGLGEVQPGDRCYVFYKKFVDAWRAEPRWTTVHSLYGDMATWFDTLDSADDAIAYRLAWEVFFALHVLPYEEQKRKENGDI